MQWCYKCINDHTKNIMPGFRMLAFQCVERQGALQAFESFLLSPKSYLKIYLN